MIRLEIGLEIRHGVVMWVRTIEDKTAVVVVASYRSGSRFKKSHSFKALAEWSKAHRVECLGIVVVREFDPRVDQLIFFS